MGITYAKTTIKNPEHPASQFIADFLIDSGATYTVVPRRHLERIGIKPHRTQEFTLADGTKIKRQMGDAVFEFEGIRGAAPVVFGTEKDSFLLGAITLEALGLILNPFERTLRPMRTLMV